MNVELNHQEPIVLNLWSESHKPPHPCPLKVAESEPDDKGRIYNVSQPTISVFRPKEQSSKPRRAVIICPGGSYQYVATDKEGNVFAKFLATNGIVGIVLKYRTPQGVPQIPFEDAQQALNIVLERAQEWGIDPNKIGMMGFSSGGHIAAITSTSGVLRPAFTVLYYPLISLRDDITHELSSKNLIADMPLQNQYSAELLVDQNTPPTLMFCTLDDAGVSIANTYLYYNTLRLNNIPCQLEIYPTGGHGWGFSLRMPEREKMKNTLLNWINEI